MTKMCEEPVKLFKKYSHALNAFISKLPFCRYTSLECGSSFITWPRKVVESWDWAQNVCIDEMNNFIEDDFPIIPLVFKMIDIIELIGSRYKW